MPPILFHMVYNLYVGIFIFRVFLSNYEFLLPVFLMAQIVHIKRSNSFFKWKW